MLEQCDFMELTEEVLLQCKGFTCKDEDIRNYIIFSDYFNYINVSPHDSGHLVKVIPGQNHLRYYKERLLFLKL